MADSGSAKFEAILSFVEDLWSEFGKSGGKTSPLALYRRLAVVAQNHPEGLNKLITGFVSFFASHERDVTESNFDAISRGVRIPYAGSERVYIDIGVFLARASGDARAAIRQHLLTIAALISPDQKRLEALERPASLLPGIDTSTKEGAFVNGMMEQAKKAMENVDATDPVQAMMGLANSGILGTMINGLQQGIGEGGMNLQTLLGVMQGALGALVPPPTPTTTVTGVEEIHDAVPTATPEVEKVDAAAIEAEESVRRLVESDVGPKPKVTARAVEAAATLAQGMGML